MPKFLIPHRTGAHRIAAIALFRALLTQCKALQLPAQQSTELQNIVRNRFKAQRHVTSYRQLTVSFTAGYEAIDHLDDAVAGNEESKKYLLDLAEKTQFSAKQTPPPPGWVQKEQKEAARKEKARLEREARPKTDIFARPLPLEMLSGKRHIPVLFSANRIPVLRFKKPQPPQLSAYINSRIRTRQKRHDRRMQFEDELALANEEDKWDSIMYGMHGLDSRAADECTLRDPPWRQEAHGALQEVLDLLDREREKNKEMAEKMQAVVDRETALAAQEVAEGKAEKPKRRRPGKRAREAEAEARKNETEAEARKVAAGQDTGS